MSDLLPFHFARLRSGGPLMFVCEGEPVPDNVFCLWFDTRNRLQNAVLPLYALNFEPGPDAEEIHF